MSRLALLSVLLVVVVALSLPQSALGANHPFVFNGTAAKTDQFKFIVGIYVNSSSICTGFVINKHYIGTAAHCIASNYLNSTYHVVTYENDTNLQETPDSKTKAHVLAVHPLFSLKTLTHDVALLRTLRPLVLGDTVLSVPLASSLPANGDFVHNAGYGDTATDFNNYTLNYITVPYMDRSHCQEFYPNNSLATCICAAGFEGKSSCFGDSGGPLFTATDVENPTDAQVIGIVSYGKACGSTIPVVYTDVPGFAKPWFEQKISAASYCAPDCRQDFKVCRGTRKYCRTTRNACLSKCQVF